MRQVDHRNTRKRCETCSKLTIKTGIMSLTSFWWLYCQLWKYFTSFSRVPIVYFEQVNVCWRKCFHQGFLLGSFLHRAMGRFPRLFSRKKGVLFTQKLSFVSVFSCQMFSRVAFLFHVSGTDRFLIKYFAFLINNNQYVCQFLFICKCLENTALFYKTLCFIFFLIQQASRETTTLYWAHATKTGARKT